jgi:arginase family enzyme
MKDISFYFKPVDDFYYNKESIGNTIDTHLEGAFPEIEKKSIAIFYCPEFRNSNFSNNSNTTSFRSYLYNLYHGLNWNKKIYDLGDFILGETVEDTYFGVRNIIAELIKNDVIPIMIGGGQDLVYPIYLGYSDLEQVVNFVSIDYKFDFGSIDSRISNNAFLDKILTHVPCHLFNYSVIGLQAPFLKTSEIELFEKLYFDALRLGEYNSNFKKAEPLIRNTDALNIDLTSIKSSDFSNKNENPNGFYSEQICQIARYAGISDKLTSFSLFNYYNENITSNNDHLIAQIIWYFIDGVNDRKGDFPVCAKSEYKKFTVHFDSFDEVVFYKSNKSERWWLEVPHPTTANSNYKRHYLVPCNHEDYELASKNELPDLWWKTYQKLK